MIKQLHGLRGIMSVLILFHHLLPFLFVGHQLFIVENLRHAVDVFFVLSGYVMCHVYGSSLPFSMQRFRHYLVHRVARIVPLAWASVGMYFIVYALISLTGMPIRHPFDISGVNLVGNLLFLDSNVPGITSAGVKWSVSNEWIVYFTVFPFVYLLPSKRYLCFMGILMVGAVQYIFWQDLSEIGTLFSRCIPGFIAGCILYRANIQSLTAVQAVWISLLGICGFFIFEDKSQLLFSVLLVLASLNLPRGLLFLLNSKFSLLLGDISYSLYLLHSIFVLAVAGVLSRYPSAAHIYALWMPVPIACSLVLAYLSFRYFEIPAKIRTKNFLNSKGFAP